jgi:hypothetical protein
MADHVTDNRPEPKYGQYAPIPPATVQEDEPPVAPAPAEIAAEPTALLPRRNWDVVLTTFLLLMAVFDVVTGFARFADLAGALRDTYAVQGITGFDSDALAATFGVVINVSRIVLLVIAIVWSLRRISRHRISFWVPLVLAFVSGLVVVVCVLVVVLNDPAFTAYVMEQTKG